MAVGALYELGLPVGRHGGGEDGGHVRVEVVWGDEISDGMNWILVND